MLPISVVALLFAIDVSALEVLSRLERPDSLGGQLFKVNDKYERLLRSGPDEGSRPPHSARMLQSSSRLQRRFFDPASHNLDVKLTLGLDKTQQLEVRVDTGSADLVIPLQSSENCNGAALDPVEFDTYLASPTSYQNEYMGGNDVTGHVARAQMQLGSNRFSQEFAAIEECAGVSLDTQGVLGLAFPALSSAKLQNPFLTMLENGVLDDAVFSLYFAQGPEKPSDVCWGCIDPTKHTEDIRYHPLRPDNEIKNGPQMHWTIGGGEVLVNGRSVAATFSRVAIDSGNYMIAMSPRQAKSIYEQIPNSKNYGIEWSVPCATPPMKIEFVFDGQPYVLPWDDFMAASNDIDENECFGAIMGLPNMKNEIIIGSAFLKKYYTVFDYGRKQVGFAPAA